MRKQLSTGQATVPDYENSASTQNQIPRNSVPNNNSIFREKHIIISSPHHSQIILEILMEKKLAMIRNLSI